MEEKDEYPATSETKAISRRQNFVNSKFWIYCRQHKLIVIPSAMLLLLLPLLGLIALKDRHGARAEWTSPILYPSRE